jgi:ribose/xylose/arabinose/galactoside ABC-type transport system permease subunit
MCRMTRNCVTQWIMHVFRALPILVLAATALLFGILSERFFSSENLLAILEQASWLIILALGAYLVVMTSGIDLSAGSVMYVAVVAVALVLPHLPLAAWPITAMLVGGIAGGFNGLLVVRAKIPAFIATLALAFVFRGVGLFLSGTQMVIANGHVAEFGRSSIGGVSGPFLLASGAFALAWLLMCGTPFGLYVRAVGADLPGAERVGVPVAGTRITVYVLGGALAGLGGFVSFGQTSAATAAFGLNAEFLAIAAAVLGGASLSGGRGTIWAPVVGAVLIATIQNGLVMIDATPYAYPVVTGGVIFLAALLDSMRKRFSRSPQRRSILAIERTPWEKMI